MAIYGGTPAAGTAIAVTNAATALVAASDNRLMAQFQNMGTVPVYIGGGTAVGTASGWPVLGGTTWPTIPANIGQGAWYGIVAAGTVEVRVLEFG